MTIFRFKVDDDGESLTFRICSRETGSSSLLNTKVAPLEFFSENEEKHFNGTKVLDHFSSVAVSNNFFVSYDDEILMSGLITPY